MRHNLKGQIALIHTPFCFGAFEKYIMMMKAPDFNSFFFRVVNWFPSFNIYNFNILCGNIPVTIHQQLPSFWCLPVLIYRQGVWCLHKTKIVKLNNIILPCEIYIPTVFGNFQIISKISNISPGPGWYWS